MECKLEIQGEDTVELTEREVLELKMRQVQAEIARLRQIGDEPEVCHVRCLCFDWGGCERCCFLGSSTCD